MRIDLGSYSHELLLTLRDAIKKELEKRKMEGRARSRECFVKTLNPLDFSTESGFDKAVFHRNSSKHLSIPFQDERPDRRSKYLRHLLAQDWSDLFMAYSPDGADFYVYAHVDPSDRVFVSDENSGGNYHGMPFYIGKGTGGRAWDLKRNQGHGKKIRQVISLGFDKDSIVKVVKSGISEREAMELESKLIYFFGTIYERDKGSTLYNLDLSSRPVFVGDMQKLERNYRARSDYRNARSRLGRDSK